MPVLEDMIPVAGPEFLCSPGVDLEAELKEAMEYSLPHPEDAMEAVCHDYPQNMEDGKSHQVAVEVNPQDIVIRTKRKILLKALN